MLLTVEFGVGYMDLLECGASVVTRCPDLSPGIPPYVLDKATKKNSLATAGGWHFFYNNFPLDACYHRGKSFAQTFSG